MSYQSIYSHIFSTMYLIILSNHSLPHFQLYVPKCLINPFTPILPILCTYMSCQFIHSHTFNTMYPNVLSIRSLPHCRRRSSDPIRPKVHVVYTSNTMNITQCTLCEQISYQLMNLLQFFCTILDTKKPF